MNENTDQLDQLVNRYLGPEQGNRASKACHEGPKEVVTPARFFEFPAV
ncbi:MAG: hypothetical protein GY717_11740 [Rhodobacteraceae bacterium]|nr:hypothetical protein [Paracoccaceae bacterium]